MDEPAKLRGSLLSVKAQGFRPSSRLGTIGRRNAAMDEAIVRAAREE